jgi:hypothetical protein
MRGFLSPTLQTEKGKSTSNVLGAVCRAKSRRYINALDPHLDAPRHGRWAEVPHRHSSFLAGVGV